MVVFQNFGKVTAYATELWSFIPQDVLTKLYEVYVNRGPGSGKHAYLVDGDPVLYFKDMPSSTSLRGDTRVSLETEDAVADFGERKGGRSYWALAISGSKDKQHRRLGRPIRWSLGPCSRSFRVTRPSKPWA